MNATTVIFTPNATIARCSVLNMPTPQRNRQFVVEVGRRQLQLRAARLVVAACEKRQA